MEFVLILTLSAILLPLFCLLRRAKRRLRARLRAIQIAGNSGAARLAERSLNPHDSLIEARDYLIGELSCRYNARSPYLRCAVNPDGPCEGCPHYQQRDRKSSRN